MDRARELFQKGKGCLKRNWLMAYQFFKKGFIKEALFWKRPSKLRPDNSPSHIFFLMDLCHSLLGHYKKAMSLDPYLLEATSFIEGFLSRQLDMMRLNPS